MRTLNVMLVLGLMFVFAATVSAQEGKAKAQQQGGGHGGILRLLQDADVKSQFDITTAQEHKIAAFVKEYNEMQGSPLEKRKAMNEKLGEILSKEQMKKVEILRFQLAGGIDGNFSLDSLVTALDLNEKQAGKIKKIIAERTEKAKAINEGTADKKEQHAKRQELFKETREKIEGVLTAAEKEKAAKLTEEGKAFQAKFFEKKEEPKAGKKGAGKGEGKKGKKN